MIKQLIILISLLSCIGLASADYDVQNETLYLYGKEDLQYKITSDTFNYGGSKNINTILCDNNSTVVSGWIKVFTDKEYNCDYEFIININDSSYQSKIITLKQELIDSSIISKKYKRTCLIDGYNIYNYNTTIYIVSILPNPIYFYFNLEDGIIQFGKKQFTNQTLVFNQLNLDDQYYFMGNATKDKVVMKIKSIDPHVKSAELKGLTGIVLNIIGKIPIIGKSLKNALYYPLFIIQALFDFSFTFIDIIIHDWWYGLMTLEIICIMVATKKNGYTAVMAAYVQTHVYIIMFIYEKIILNIINLIIALIRVIRG